MPTAISTLELVNAMQSQRAPQVIDVRRQPAFDSSQRMIDNARWCNPEAIDSWMHELDIRQDVVVYCVYGHEVGKNCAAQLKRAGFRASYLDGGFEQWAAEGQPTVGKP